MSEIQIRSLTECYLPAPLFKNECPLVGIFFINISKDFKIKRKIFGAAPYPKDTSGGCQKGDVPPSVRGV
jgi:hypothetical protein